MNETITIAFLSVSLFVLIIAYLKLRQRAKDLQISSQKLKEANQKLQELDQLKDDFVSIVSHELKTPMASIRSYAWMALHRSDVQLSEKLKKYLIRVLISTERLINLVNDMLNVSRIEAGRIGIIPEAVDLQSLIKDIADELYYSKSDSKKIQFIIPQKQAPKVFADPEKLREIFFNLVGNSLKFTPTGGKISFDFVVKGEMVEISVKDSGVGISKDDLGKLFQKFSRLDNSYVASASSGGTGLGLYISKNIIELMNGKIWAQSEGINKGSTFTFSLPIATEEIMKNADQYIVNPKEGAVVKPLESALFLKQNTSSSQA